MNSAKLKFLKEDVEYWERQLRIYPTELGKDSLERSKKRLEDHKKSIDNKDYQALESK